MYHSIGKKHIDVGYSALTDLIELSYKAPKFKTGDTVRITKYKNIFSKGYTKNYSREIFIIDCVLITNPSTCKTKDLNRERIINKLLNKL